MERHTTRKPGAYIEQVGRRKTAIARVRMTEAAKSSTVINDRPAAQYFPLRLQSTIEAPIKKAGVEQKFAMTVHVSGSGPNAQAEAIRHGISRVLIVWNPELRGVLKKAGFLKRDARAVERKKFGLKKARKAPTWSKR